MKIIFLPFLLIITFGVYGQNNVIDERDGNSYKIFELGDLLWFKSNLKFKTPTSWCSENPNSDACNSGNFYYPTDLINVCPTGWRVPTWKEYKQAIQQIQKFYNLTDTTNSFKGELPLYKELKLEAERIVNLTLIGDSTFFDMATTGWVEGDKWELQNQTTLWIIHEISNTPQPHIHISPNDIIMHSHGHNVIDKPKKLRRFAVRCVADKN
jgi:uncharacterized protein (TIGR02145 family)